MNDPFSSLERKFEFQKNYSMFSQYNELFYLKGSSNIWFLVKKLSDHL